MSGRKQHYIPQTILRGFGNKQKNDSYVTAYSRKRGVFGSNTKDVAAEREFYSKLYIDFEEETLDDKITTFEYRIPNVLSEFNNAPSGDNVDTEKASELITHLILRTAQVRDSFAHAGRHIFSAVGERISTKEKLWTLLGFDGSKPNPVFVEELSKFYHENKPQMDEIGLDFDSFKEVAFIYAKQQFDNTAEDVLPMLKSVVDKMISQADEITKSGHQKALEKSLVPESRMKDMRKFSWKVEDIELGEYILPDCVAVCLHEDGSYRPAIYSEIGKSKRVLMPLNKTRLLIADIDCLGLIPPSLNNIFAASSWDFFITGEIKPKWDKMYNNIGKYTEKLIQDSVIDAFEE